VNHQDKIPKLIRNVLTVQTPQVALTVFFISRDSHPWKNWKLPEQSEICSTA
jgi:hypothetical protein